MVAGALSPLTAPPTLSGPPAYTWRGGAIALVVSILMLLALGVLVLLLTPSLSTFAVLSWLFALLLVVTFFHGMQAIHPYETGLVFVLGKFQGAVAPGFRIVNPLAHVIRVDLRTQERPLTKYEGRTSDGIRALLGGKLYFKVADPVAAIIKVQEYRLATAALVASRLEEELKRTPIREVVKDRGRLGERVRDLARPEARKWGVQVESVDLGDLEVLGPERVPGIEKVPTELLEGAGPPLPSEAG
ncbi:MAG: SPFH domain-containing protein [Euryarchaeota archaeon]|nr:SPFH domain-containing protein [Euryarchaeota archaeon]MDE1835972.1 SPFH domain-containing protein [Euryarchaeota archaeon]MDE1882078.1 SPFH domain-containing protein [Euryarchaeota archaeon]MDE2044349.1 SPFH domain-containing protein [Thermoplasmata archaeon]